LAGFPCQAFSIAGYQQGFDDAKGRGTLFFELMRFVRQHNPRVVFLENVKNLVSHDHGNTFKVILEELSKAGYEGKISYKVMNAMTYGNIPQNRERIYIVAFRDTEDFTRFKMPEPIPLTTALHDVIDFAGRVDPKYYYTKEHCLFYDKLQEAVLRNDTVYQWRRQYIRENKSGVVPTLTANMGTGGHNVPIIRCWNGSFRKLTPKECFNIQGFPKEFQLPKKQGNTQLYKQAGNSVVVPVIQRIAEAIALAVGEEPVHDNIPSIILPDLCGIIPFENRQVK
ncbi:MAG: DNA (cytosine-5-)-methyltransferase, partial [Planctomycetia bacterium]|nr:DNA (cytosine-5-)-methyltransferase [Planctomycetia bacterium]